MKHGIAYLVLSCLLLSPLAALEVDTETDPSRASQLPELDALDQEISSGANPVEVQEILGRMQTGEQGLVSGEESLILAAAKKRKKATKKKAKKKTKKKKATKKKAGS